MKSQEVVVFACMFSLVLVFSLTFTQAESVDVVSGNITYAVLEATFDTNNWAALKVVNSGSGLGDDNDPFATISFSNPFILQTSFAGTSLENNNYYYAAGVMTTINTSLISNSSAADTVANGMFNAVDFPQFYPSYLGLTDNPDATFCCATGIVTLGGRNYSALTITVDDDVEYFVLKYNNGGQDTPLFLVEIADWTCYNGTACNAQFLLPISDTDYNFFVLSQVPSYDFQVWIDGVETTAFAQTALPYNLTIRATDRLSGAAASNIEVLAGEQNGQNIFIPFRESGIVGNSYSLGETDSNGYESWLVAPTSYPSYAEYLMYVAAYVNFEGEYSFSSEQALSITSEDVIVFQSKTLSPSLLLDNAKVAVNAMAQIINFAFIWASEEERANEYTLEYNVVGDVWDIELDGNPSNLTLKSGAINTIDVTLRNGGGQTNDYTLQITEDEGYLLVNPYTGSSPYDSKSRTHFMEISTGETLNIVPTSLGAIQSNITLVILDTNGDVFSTYYASIDDSLENPDDVTTDTSNDDDDLKTFVNRVNSVASSLFYALNN